MSNYVNLLDIIYPVGSIYISADTISPADTVGGVWKQITGSFLRGIEDNDIIGATGGKGKHHHVIAFLFPEYYGWGNITGNHTGGMYPHSGITCLSGEEGDGTFITSSGFHLNPLNDSGQGSNYVSNIMTEKTGYVQKTDIKVQYGSTTTDNNIPPYYNVAIYQRIS